MSMGVGAWWGRYSPIAVSTIQRFNPGQDPCSLLPGSSGLPMLAPISRRQRRRFSSLVSGKFVLELGPTCCGPGAVSHTQPGLGETMAASYWDSTQRKHWTFTKDQLATMRQKLEDEDPALVQSFGLPQLRHLNIFFNQRKWPPLVL